jgi:hypothetical protein
MSSQGVIDAEGMRSPNRNGSRLNAIKHGLTAKTAVLPGEDEVEYQARIDFYKESLETRNPVEDDLAKRAAQASWQLDRANGAETARLTRDILTKPAAESLRAELEAVALGQRLYFDRRGPIELYPSRDYDKQQPRTSWDDDPNDPDHPANLIPQLEATLAGCGLLLKYWGELRAVLELGLGWQSHEKLKCIRLMGRQPINAAGVREVAEVFLACHAIEPQFSYAFQELRCEIHEDRFKMHRRQLDRWIRAGIVPVDATAGRAVLMRIVDLATARLRMLEAKHQEVADTLGGLATKILSFDESKSGDQLRRHVGSCNRLMHRNIEAIRKGRRDLAQGWGKTRKERERKKAEKRAGAQLDERLVLDDHGDVCIAEDYDDDIDEGMARYEKELGMGTPRPRRWVVNEVIPPAVPDFARWSVEEGRRKEGGERRSDGADRAEPSLGDRSEGVQPTGVVPLVLAEKGERANLQNETGEGGRAIEEGSEETFGLEGGGARDPRRTEAGDGVGEPGATEDLVPLMFVDKGERENQQNEIGAPESEPQRLPDESGVNSWIKVKQTAERDEERSDAGASERGISENQEAPHDVRNGTGTQPLFDVQPAAERDEERTGAGASERENEELSPNTTAILRGHHPGVP